MGTRRKARELALQVLFEFDFSQKPLQGIFDRLQKDEELETQTAQFLEQLLGIFSSHQSEIDEMIEKHSSNWRLSRMTAVDRNILRLGVSEILFIDDVPKNVTINECLEIAKKFGTENSSSFVNGILDNIQKNES